MVTKMQKEMTSGCTLRTCRLFFYNIIFTEMQTEFDKLQYIHVLKYKMTLKSGN